MEIRNYENLDKLSTPHKVEVVKLHQTDDVVVIHILLKPGESLLPHITPVDVFFYVLSGNPTILVGDQEQQVGRDDIIESPKGIKHLIKNESDSPARILVVKTPKPVSETKIL